MNKILLCLILSFSLVNLADAATFEEQFNNKQYEQFLPAARAEAAKGNADALFLLGKAYHLGLGVPVDLAQAKTLYQQAREKGSARASHNLGTIALDAGLNLDAIKLFEEALSRGLKHPTLYNLGKANSPPEGALNFWPHEAKPLAEQLIKSGDYFAQAYALKPDSNYYLDASRQFLRAYMIAKKANSEIQKSFDLPALKKQTITWLQIGMDKNDLVSWTNYGVLMLEDKNYPEAKKALQKGASQNNAVANFHLGTMAEEGLGQPVDKDQAIIFYEKAAQQGNEDARFKAKQLLKDSLEYTSDIAKLEQGVKRLKALQKPDDEDFSDLPSSPQSRLESEKAWDSLLKAQRQAAKPLPNLPVVLNACELDLNQTFGNEFNLGWNTAWKLVAYPARGESELLGIEGRVSEKGCAFNKNLPAKVRTLLEKGIVLALRFPNYTLPLKWQKDSKAVTLSLMPIGSPIPNF